MLRLMEGLHNIHLYRMHILCRMMAVLTMTSLRSMGEKHIKLKVNGDNMNIPLSFDGDIMKMKLRVPSEEEL